MHSDEIVSHFRVQLKLVPNRYSGKESRNNSNSNNNNNNINESIIRSDNMTELTNLL